MYVAKLNLFCLINQKLSKKKKTNKIENLNIPMFIVSQNKKLTHPRSIIINNIYCCNPNRYRIAYPIAFFMCYLINRSLAIKKKCCPHAQNPRSVFSFKYKPVTMDSPSVIWTRIFEIHLNTCDWLRIKQHFCKVPIRVYLRVYHVYFISIIP